MKEEYVILKVKINTTVTYKSDVYTYLLILLSLKSNIDSDRMYEKLSPFKLLILLLPR